jgi:hypothetical protein
MMDPSYQQLAGLVASIDFVQSRTLPFDLPKGSVLDCGNKCMK